MRHDAHYVEEMVKANRTVGRIIAINLIEPNPEQPRSEFGDLTELKESIAQKGVLEPLLVKPIRGTGNFMIIAGERRWRAANLAGLREVPCIELDIDDRAVAEIALIENMQRKDLSIWEEADGLAQLAKTFGYTHDEIAKKISKSRTTVTESMTLAGIPDDIREKCRKANISAKSTLLEVARQFDDAAMHVFVDNILRTGNRKRDDVRKSARPEGKSSTAKSDPKPVPTDGPSPAFRFNSGDGDFTVEIRFNRDEYGRKDVLKALKAAFDAVKSGHSGNS